MQFRRELVQEDSEVQPAFAVKFLLASAFQPLYLPLIADIRIWEIGATVNGARHGGRLH